MAKKWQNPVFFDEICILLLTKNGIFGGKIPWSLTVTNQRTHSTATKSYLSYILRYAHVTASDNTAFHHIHCDSETRY